LQDQIFLMDAAEEGSIGFPVAISNLVIQGGQVNPNTGLVTSGGAFLWEAGTDGTGQLRLTNVNINGNTATDPGSPGLDDGGAMALFNTASVTTPAQVTITGSTIQSNQASSTGGGMALKGAISLTLSNSAVSGNKALGGGIQQGGGLIFSLGNNPLTGGTSSPSFIQHSTISANVAGSGGLGEGGAVYTEQTLTINQGSVITANSAGGVGGGIATALATTTDQVVISSSTITGNSTSGSGGGVEVDAGSNANLQLSFNRIIGNTANGGGNGLSNLGTGTVSATDNWWGCNEGPQPPSSGVSKCDTASGSTTFDPWIVLSHSASPNTVLRTDSATLTASFLQDHSGAPLSASNLGALIGIPITFNNAINGTLSNAQPVIQPDGTATATLTATALPTASADATVDHATVTATLKVQDFSVSVAPATVNIGSSTARLTITVTGSNTFNSVVTLACGTLPAGITCPSGSFNPPTVTGSGTSILTVNIDSSVAPGTYSIPVNGTSGADTRSGSGNLTLADFSLSISPSTETIILNQTATYTVTCSTTTGYSGSVQLSSSLSGTSFTPNPMPCPGTSQAAVTPATTGNFTLTVSGTALGVTRTAGASLIVQDFSVSVSSVTVNNGSSTASLTITVSSINGFNGVVTLSCGTMPAGITCPSGAFNPAAVTPPANGSVTSILTVNISSSVAPGAYGIPANGTSGGVTRSGTGTITQTSTVATPKSLVIIGSVQSNLAASGQTALFSVTVNGFTATATYCECVIGGQFPDNPSAIATLLANAFNGASGSPVTASASGGLLSLTAKAAGVALNISSADGGDQGGGIGGLSFIALPMIAGQGSIQMGIVGSVRDGSSSTFSATVNGSTASATYCECQVPGELGGQFPDNPTAMATLLANALNGASGSPVTASTSGFLTLTSKTQGAALTVTSSDDGAGLGGLGGISFLAMPAYSNQNTSSLAIIGSVRAGSNSTFSVTVNGFTASATYCECLIPGELSGQFPDNPSAMATILANAFNGASGSPVTASDSGGLLTLTSKTQGTVLTVTSNDDGAGLGGLGGISFIGVPQPQ